MSKFIMATLSFRALFARVAISTLAVKIGSTGLAFGLSIFLARILGPQHYGDYVFSLSLVSILVLLGTLGMEGAALRFVAGYVGQEAWGLLRGFIQRGAQWVMIASFSIALLFGVGTVLVKHMLRPDLVDIFMVGLALIPISAMLAFVGPCLQALSNRYVVLAQSVQLLRISWLGLLVLGLVWVDSGQLDSITVMELNLITTMLVLIVFITILYRKIPWQVKKAPPIFEDRQWLVTTLPFLALAGFNLIIIQTDTIMVGMFLGTDQAGFYATASRIAILITFGIASANAIVAPMISQYYAQQRLQELQHIVSVSAKGIFLFALSAAIVLLIFGKTILGLFGPEFRVAYLSLTILLFGQLIDSFAGSVGYLMTMTGHQREAMYVIGGCALLNIILNSLLIPVFGLPGAAIATATTIALWNIILARLVKTNLNINSTAFYFQGH